MSLRIGGLVLVLLSPFGSAVGVEKEKRDIDIRLHALANKMGPAPIRCKECMCFLSYTI